jgi:thymidylate synthase
MENDLVYLNALKEVLETGEKRQSRNSFTLSKFSIKMDFDLKDKFPLLTTKKMFWKGICEELLWFIKGKTNSKELEEKGVNIWKGNSSKEFLNSVGLHNNNEGDCGEIYGFQWRHFGAQYYDCNYDYKGQGFDQLQNCINLIKTDLFSRRIFMSAWNPAKLDNMCLPPCHVSYQFYVNSDDELSCMMYQRSGDMFLGIPFNIASASLLTYIIAHLTNKRPSKLSIVIGDAHIYENHIDQVKEQLTRKPYESPKLIIKHNHINIDEYLYEDFEIVDYQFHPSIKAIMIA